MVIDPSIFKSYDIRGIYPEQINEKNIRLIARAIYSFFKLKIEKEKFNIFLAYDMRLSGPQLFDAVKNELLQMGADIIDGGQLYLDRKSTPVNYCKMSI